MLVRQAIRGHLGNDIPHLDGDHRRESQGGHLQGLREHLPGPEEPEEMSRMSFSRTLRRISSDPSFNHFCFLVPVVVNRLWLLPAFVSATVEIVESSV